MAVRPTPKAAALAAITTVLLVASLAGLYPHVTGSLAVALSAVLGWSLGYARSLSHAAYRVEVSRRVEPDAAYEDSVVKVAVRVANSSSRRLEAVVEDAVPARLRLIDSPVFAVDLEPGGAAEYTYRVKPYPGLHVFRVITLSVVDPLGLFALQRRVETVSTVKAYPSLQLVEAVGRSHYWGYVEAYSRLVRGVGLEFYEIREYQPGDDPRRIVWSAVARTGRLMVREDLAETMPKIYVVLDLSAPMWAGSIGDMPGDHAMRLAVALAWAASKAAGKLGYTLVRGEAWSATPLVRASEALSRLLVSLAGFDPLEAVTGKGWSFCRAVEEAKLYVTSDTVVVAVSGPHILSPLRADHAASCLKGLRSALLIVLPEGRGPLSARVKAYGLRLASSFSNRYTRLGVPVFVAEGSTPPPELWRWLTSWAPHAYTR